jgi:hypothetical protein
MRREIWSHGRQLAVNLNLRLSWSQTPQVSLNTHGNNKSSPSYLNRWRVRSVSMFRNLHTALTYSQLCREIFAIFRGYPVARPQ